MSQATFLNRPWVIDHISVAWVRRTKAGVQQARKEWHARLHKEVGPWDVVLSRQLFVDAQSVIAGVQVTVGVSGQNTAPRTAPLFGVWNAESIDMDFRGKTCMVTTSLFQTIGNWVDVPLSTTVP